MQSVSQNCLVSESVSRFSFETCADSSRTCCSRHAQESWAFWPEQALASFKLNSASECAFYPTLSHVTSIEA